MERQRKFWVWPPKFVKLFYYSWIWAFVLQAAYRSGTLIGHETRWTEYSMHPYALGFLDLTKKHSFYLSTWVYTWALSLLLQGLLTLHSFYFCQKRVVENSIYSTWLYLSLTRMKSLTCEWAEPRRESSTAPTQLQPREPDHPPPNWDEALPPLPAPEEPPSDPVTPPEAFSNAHEDWSVYAQVFYLGSNNQKFNVNGNYCTISIEYPAGRDKAGEPRWPRRTPRCSSGLSWRGHGGGPGMK